MNSIASVPQVINLKLAKANKTLKISTWVLFSIALIGQLWFVYYIVSFYGGTAINGNTEAWNEELYVGLIEGDVFGNFVLMLHLFLAAIITFGGPLQFIPQIRTRAPKFHRWNGRIYIFTALLISLAGLYMIYTRDVIGGAVMQAGNTINAILIISFSLMTIKTAMAKKFDQHGIWAIRTFIVVSGVWFFRIGFGLWIAINMGEAPGVNEDFSGPFTQFLAFAHTLLPLAILETYFMVKKGGGIKSKYILSGGLIILTVMLAAGIGMAAMIFWM